MNYQKQYANKIGWQNSPDTSTPINATNLGKMDNALWYMDDAMYVLSKLIAGGSSVKGGIITNVGSNIFTTHLEMRSGEDLSTGELLLLRSNVSGSGNGINVYIDEYMAVGFGFVDLSGTATSVTLSSSSVLLLMLDVEENTAQVLSVLGEGGGGGGLPETPLAIIHGGTGNTVGYIQTGRAESTTIGLRATAEGGENESSGEASHAEGSYNVASGNNSHAEGYGTTASDLFAHAEGYNTTASEDATHAEGRGTTASDWYAHAEGHDTTASGEASHAEGASTTASNTGAHSEGISTTASGHSSHAGGVNSIASGTTSFAQGLNVTAGYDYQTVVGKYNNNISGTLFEIGNGTASNAKSNALEVYSDGRVHTNKFIVGNDNQVGANTVTGIAMGSGVTAGYENQVAVGVANNNRSDTLFEVGNGSLRGQHKNAFEVYSNGNIKAQGTVSDANGVLNAVEANMPDAPVALLNKLKIGSTIYDATAVKPYTVSSITSGTTGVIRVTTISTNSIDGDLIAITTGSNSGTTTNAWALGLNSGGTYLPIAMTKADGTDFKDDLSENELLFVYVDTTSGQEKAIVVNVAGASGGGASALTDLTDTAITSPTDGQVLTYNSTTGKWGNQNNIANVLSDNSIQSRNDVLDSDGHSLSAIGEALETVKLASGNPVVVTDALPEYADDVKVEINYVQSGSGTPSLTNKRPISGWSSVTINHVDSDSQTVSILISIGQAIYGGILDVTTGVITITWLLVEFDGSADESWSKFGSGSASAYAMKIANTTGTAKANVVPVSNYATGALQNYLYSEYDCFISTHDLTNWVGGKKNVTTVSAWRQFLEENPMQVCYELDTPITISITGTDILLYTGYNSLSANSGSMTLAYKAVGKKADEAQICANIEDGNTASKAYSVNEFMIRGVNLYKVTANIASGAIITSNNTTKVTITEILTALLNA